MAFNIHFLAFILLAVSLKTRLQVVPFTSFHHFLFARFGCTFSAAVAYDHCRSRVNFLHLTKSKTFIRSRPSNTTPTLLIIILSGDIQVNPGPTSIYPCGCCELPVTWDHQRAVCCDNCKLWYHSECIELSSSKINVLQFSNISWICCHYESLNVDSFTYHSYEFELSNCFSVLSDLSSVSSVESCFCPKACSTPILKLDKPCLIEYPVKSNESIKVNQVKSVSNSSILMIIYFNFISINELSKY